MHFKACSSSVAHPLDIAVTKRTLTAGQSGARCSSWTTWPWRCLLSCKWCKTASIARAILSSPAEEPLPAVVQDTGSVMPPASSVDPVQSDWVGLSLRKSLVSQHTLPAPARCRVQFSSAKAHLLAIFLLLEVFVVHTQHCFSYVDSLPVRFLCRCRPG